jgi:hypothetical protein
MAEEIKVIAKYTDEVGPGVKKTATVVDRSTEKMSDSFKGLGSTMRNLAVGAAGLVVFQKAASFLNDSALAATEAEKADARLNQTLKATKGIAGLTFNELKKMSSGLQEVTTVGDEAINGAQQLLLTFKQIGGDVFPRALESILDVSEGMGQDLKSSAVQVGKALNDPTTGLTALSRVGITFSEQQKENIKQFQNTNEIAKAQAIILEELESQFGGLAKAVAEVPSGELEQVKNEIGDIQEEIGVNVIPFQIEWNKLLLKATQFTRDLVNEWNVLLGLGDDRSEQVANEITELVELRKGYEETVKVIESIEEPSLFQKEDLEQAKSNIEAINQEIASFGKKSLGIGVDTPTADNKALTSLTKEQKKANEKRIKQNEESIAWLIDQEGEMVDTLSAFQGEVTDVYAQESSKRVEISKDDWEKMHGITEEEIQKEKDIITGVNEAYRQISMSESQIELADLQNWYEERLAIVEEGSEQELKLHEIFVARRNEIEEKGSKRQELILNNSLSVTSDYLGEIAALLQATLGDQKQYEAAYKAIAIASVVIDTAQASMAAYRSVSEEIGGTAGVVLGALAAGTVTAAGAVQVAKISNTSFEDGGIVPGTSFTGDNVNANVNSGEMIMNQGQQKDLWEFIRGGSNTVNNTSSVNFSPVIQITGNATEETTEQMIEQMKTLLEDMQYRGELVA